MNQKVYSVLFCALLASTFVHEIRAKWAANPSFATHVLTRAAAQSQACEMVCSSNSTETENSTGLSIAVNVNTGLFLAINVSVNAAFIVDANASLVVVLNGTSGAAVIINVKTNTGFYISKGVWEASKTSIQDFLGSFSATGLLKISGAVSFKISSASSTIVSVVNGVMASLIVKISDELRLNTKLGLEIMVTIGNQIILLLNGGLKGLQALIGTQVIALKFDLAQLVIFFGALAAIFSKISGGIPGLIAAGVVINIESLANAGNGLKVLVVLMLSLAGKIDVEDVLGTILNDVKTFFRLVAQLGGSGNIGLDGLFQVIAEIVAFIKGDVGIEIVITTVIKFLEYNGQTARRDLSAVLNSTLSVSLEAVEKIGLTNSLSGLISTLKHLKAGTFIIDGGVNISTIIDILLSGILGVKAHLLRVLVTVLLKLTAVIAVSVSLPVCLFVLIAQITTAVGRQLLEEIGIEFGTSIRSATGNIIAFILKSVSNVISLLRGELYTALTKLGPIGIILIALEKAISAVSKFSLKVLVNNSTIVRVYIRAFFQWKGGMNLGVTSENVTKTMGIVQNCTSVNAYYGISQA